MTLDLKTSGPQDPRLDASRFGVLSRLADDLAHEIKNPLHAIVINLEVLRKRVEKGDPASALKRAEVVEHEVRRVHELIESLMRVLRPAKDGPGPYSIADAVGGVLQLVAVRAKLAGVEYQEAPLPIEAYTMVAPDAMRFSTLALSEEAIAAARELRGAVSLRASMTATEAQITISSGVVLVGAIEPQNALVTAQELLSPYGAVAKTNRDGSVTIHLPLTKSLT